MFLPRRVISRILCAALLLALLPAALRHGGPLGARARAHSPQRVVIPLTGRLGNQLHQLSAALALRALTGEASIFFVRNTFSPETDFSATLFRTLPHSPTARVACRGVRGDVAKHEHHGCDALHAGLLNASCNVVAGLFQCADLAAHGRAPALALLRDSGRWRRAARLFRVEAGEVVGGTVALHVRRGDYTKKFNRGFLEPVPPSYYVAAAGHMPANATFLIFSDDIAWCEKEISQLLPGISLSRIRFVREKDAVTSLIIMLLCDHHIIANSTFSWWGAFLNENSEQIVVAPRKWMGPRAEERAEQYPKVERYPKDWIIL